MARQQWRGKLVAVVSQLAITPAAVVHGKGVVALEGGCGRRAWRGAGGDGQEPWCGGPVSRCARAPNPRHYLSWSHVRAKERERELAVLI